MEENNEWNIQFTPEAKANMTSIDQLIALIQVVETGLAFILRRGLENLLVARLGLLQVLLEVERLEEHSRALVELGLELDPVQPERVEEGAHALHDDEDRQGQDGPEAEDDEDGEGADERLAEAAGERDAEDELPQHLGELRDVWNHWNDYESNFGRKSWVYHACFSQSEASAELTQLRPWNKAFARTECWLMN